jgi:hypothetical protein
MTHVALLVLVVRYDVVCNERLSLPDNHHMVAWLYAATRW